MIVGQHTVIRSAEADDVHFLMQVYEANPLRSSLLDARRELIIPTLDELREAMGRADSGRGTMNVVEDMEGRARGFCSVRGPNMEYRFAEAVVMLIDEADYALPFTSEIADFLESQAFDQTHHYCFVIFHLPVFEFPFQCFFGEIVLACHHFLQGLADLRTGF